MITKGNSFYARNIKRAFIFGFLFVCAVMANIVTLYYVEKQKQEREAEKNGLNIISQIKIELGRCYDTTKLMGHLFKTNGDTFLTNFNNICESLQKDNLAIGSMYWAPDGVIRYAYPEAVTDATMNYSCLKDPIQGPKSELARDTRRTTIAGPHHLVEGGVGFIMRTPYYDNNGEFKAFSIMVINTEVFMEQVMTRLNETEKEYRFSLWKDDPTAVTSKEGYIISSDKPIKERIIEIPFKVPNDTWYMTIEPKEGWNVISSMTQMLTVSIFLILLGFIAMILFLRYYKAKNEKQMTQDAFKIINGLTSDFHSIWVVDKNTLKMNKLRITQDKTVKNIYSKDDMNMNFTGAFEWYVNNHVTENDRKRVMHELNAEEILRKLHYQDNYTVNYMRITNTGDSAFHQVTIANADTQDGKRQFILAFRDIDEMLKSEKSLRKELEESRIAAEKANMAKTTFLFNMSHDIRTPMNAIIGFTHLAEKQLDNKEKMADYLKKISDSSGVLLSIINHVLEMSRIEKGAMNLQEEVWSVDDCNEVLKSVFSEMAQEKGLEFITEINVEHRFTYTDSLKMREILINIISNSYKYTNPGGKIHVLVEEIPAERKKYVRYRTTITDTGIGMSEEFLPHLFEEFSRENNSTGNKIEGTGLGMSIVKKLVDLLGGTIEVKSRKGEGTTFIMEMENRMAQDPKVVEKHIAQVKAFSFEGRRILLAEDNELNTEIATEILKEAGMIVEHAENGKICVEMLQKAEAHYYDVVLMDIQMPVMNGYEAAHAIRTLEDTEKANTPILAMTANAFEEDKQEALKAGMNGHLAKPINVPQLLSELCKVMRK